MFFESITPALVSSLLPRRDEYADKLGFGRLLCVCGSRNMPGAAVLSCGGALRSGVGLCTVAAPESVCRTVSYHYPGAVLNILPEHTDGGIDPLCAGELISVLHRFTAVLFGCGVGLACGGRALLRALLQNCTLPLVIDADGLNLLCEDMSLLVDARCPVILTPHARELKRLLDASSLPDAAALAQRYGVTVVSKGACTEIYGRRRYMLSAPNSALAKGGSGDVLAGLIAGFLAQGCTPYHAAVLGVYLHALAGDIAARELGIRAMLPTDVIGCLGKAFLLLAEAMA